MSTRADDAIAGNQLSMMRRVVIVGFWPMVRLGLQALLHDAGVVLVVEAERGDIVEGLRVFRPHAVLLEHDDHTDEIATAIVTDFPWVTVIACSSDRPTMRVYPPFHQGEWYRSRLTTQSLSAAIGA